MQSMTRNSIVAGLLILVLALACPYLRAQDRELTFTYTDPAVLWDFVCERNGGCRELPVPAVQFAPLGAERGAFGMFVWSAPDRIIIDLPFVWARLGERAAVDAVIVHEMQHYYDFNLKLVAPVPNESCTAEARGFAAQTDYLLFNFAEQHIDTTWRIRYGC